MLRAFLVNEKPLPGSHASDTLGRNSPRLFSVNWLRRKVGVESNWPWYGPALFALTIIIVGGALVGLSLRQQNQEKMSTLELDLRNAVVDFQFRMLGAKEFLELLAQEIIEGRLDQAVFQKRVSSFLDNHPEISHVSFADPDGFIQWVMPEDSIPLEGTQITLAEAKAAFDQAMETRGLVFTNALASVGGGIGISLYVPAFHEDLSSGAFSAQVILEDLLSEAIKASVAEKYAITISQEDATPLVVIGGKRKLDADLTGAIPIRLVDKTLLLRFTRYQSPWDWIYLTLIVTCVGLTGGLAVSLWILARDVHRRKLTQMELQEARDAAVKANRAKSELIANISHEMRTPLGAIHGFTELLYDPAQNTTSRLQMITAIRRNAQNLLELVNDFLDMSKIEAGLLDIEKARFSLPKALAELMATFKAQAMAKGIRLKVEFEGPLPEMIESDSKRVRQILTNLVGNALKFTEQGEVSIRVRLIPEFRHRHEPGLQFLVRDSGIGITPEQQQRLFMPFLQGDSSISRRFGGSGLGLALSRRLAELLDGELCLAASKAGEGSVFALTIYPGPIVPDRLMSNLSLQEPDRIEGAQLMLREELAGLKVLVVEDCRDNQVIYASFLQAAGAEVVIASDGHEALASAASAAFDIIFMDIQMPELDGYQATRALRLQGIRTPIVAVTAHAMKGERERCLAMGCDEYLTKPVDGDTLVRTALWFTKAERRHHAIRLPADGPLKSRFCDDPRVEPVLAGFVTGMAERLCGMRTALEAGNWQQLGKMAHRLKGTAGNYGFPDLQELAASLEDVCRVNPEAEKVAPALGAMEIVHARMLAGIAGAMTHG